MSRNLIYKYREVDSGLDKITNITPIKENNQTDISYLYAPFGADTVMLKLLPNKFFELTNVNPIPAFKTIRITDQEVIDALVPEEESELGWYLYTYPIGLGISGILKSNRASQYQVSYQRLEVDLSDTDYIGNYATASTSDGTISTELDVAFPSAEEGNYVNVYKTTSNLYTSWLLVSTTWVDQDELTNETLIGNTLVYNETFKATTVSNDEFNIGTPSEQALVFNQIYGELDEINVVLSAIVGDVAGLMTKDEYATLGLTGIVDFATALDDETNLVTAAEARTKLDFIDQDLKTSASPEFVTPSVTSIEIGDTTLSYDETNRVATFDYGNGVMLQVGEESYVHAVNKEGTNMVEGEPASIIGATGQTPQFVSATTSDDDLSHKTVGILTEDIDNNAKGKITTFGLVRDINTTGIPEGETWVEGDFLFVGDGALTNVEPTKPLPKVEIGLVLISNASTGVIFVNVDKAHKLGYLSDVDTSSSVEGNMIRENSSGVYIAVDPEVYLMSRDIQNGAFKETFDFRYNATSSEMELSNPSGNNLTQQFSDGDTDLDVTTAVSIAPTFGTATITAHNYFFILQSNKGVIVNNTTGWPTVEHIRIGELVFLSEVITDAKGGPLRNQNINNHEVGAYNLGALQDIRQRLRALGAQWRSGVAGASTGSWVLDTAGTLYFTSTAGVILQMHMQTFDAKDTSGTDNLFVVNDFDTPYEDITSFDEIDEYSDGSTISNNTHFSVIVWASINKTGEYDAVFVNLPSGGYVSLANALEDPNGFVDTTVPVEFRDTAFQICKLTFKLLAGTYTLENEQDLRAGRFGVSGTTGDTGSDNEFTDNLFRILNISDATKELAFDVSEVSTATVRTVTIPDKDVDLGDIDDKIEKDLTVYPAIAAASVADDDLARMPLDDDGVQKHMTLTEIYAGANTATGSFVNSADYKGDGLGAYKSAMLSYHTLALDTLGQFKVDIKTQITDQILYVKMPTITSNQNDLQISTDDGVTYYDVLVNGGTVFAEVVSEKLLKLQFDGTNFLIDTQSLPIPLTFDSGINSTFDTVKPINGSPEFNRGYGLSLNQLVPNGNMATDTIWTKESGITITGDEMVFTGVALNDQAFQDASLAEQDVVILYEITEYTSGSIRVDAGTGELGIERSAVGRYAELISVSGSTNVSIRSRTAGTTLKLTNIMVIPLDNTPLHTHTASQINNIVQDYIEEYTTITDLEFKSIGTQLLDKREITYGAFLSGSGVAGGSVTTPSNVARAYIYVPVRELTTYVFNTQNSNIHLFWREIQEIGIENGQVYPYAQTGTHTTIAGTKYIGFNIRTVDDSPLTQDDIDGALIMFNEGTTAKPYQAYNSPEDNFKLIGSILSVGQDVRDEVYEDGGAWWKDQHVQSYVLTEDDIVSISTFGTNVVAFSDTDIFTGAIAFVSASNSDNISIESKNQIRDNATDYADVNNIDSFAGANGNLLSFVFVNGTSLANAKTALVGTVVYYELEVHITTEIEQHGSLIQESNTTIVQLNNFATKYDITFALDKDAQDELDTQKIINLQYGQDKSEEDISALQVEQLAQGVRITNIETKTDFISVTQLVDLDQMETDIGTNQNNITDNANDISDNVDAILKRVEFEVLYTNGSGLSITSNTSQGSATQVTLSSAYTNFDAIKLEFENETKEVRVSAMSRSLIWGYAIATDSWLSISVDYQFSASTTLDLWSGLNLELTPSTNGIGEGTVIPLKLFKIIGIKY